TRDAADFVLGDDGAAGEAPDAAVDHADAEAGRAAPTGTAAATAPPPAEAAAPAAPPQAAARGLTVRAAAGVDAAPPPPREADVRVAAAGLLRGPERDVREALEGRRHRVAFRRLRQQLADEIGRCEQQRGSCGVFEKVATRGAHQSAPLESPRNHE